ncbi:MAG: GNAT family protein [Chitinophagales bacterium]
MDFQLRPWKETDLESLVKYANNWNVAKNLTDGFPHPYTLEHGKSFIERSLANMPVTIFAIEVQGEAVGGIGIHPQGDIMKRNAELGYWLGEPFWNKGIISAAIPQMVSFAFAKFDIIRIFARPFGSNIASQRVLEKCGFQLEARFPGILEKQGRIEDELIYGIRKTETGG